MTAEIIPIGIPTLAPHNPDDILEAAKGKGFGAVIVIGLTDGPLWVSGSTSDTERIIFMLEWAKRITMDMLVNETSDGTGDAA